MTGKKLYWFAGVIAGAAAYMSMIFPLAELHRSWSDIGVCLLWGALNFMMIYGAVLSVHSMFTLGGQRNNAIHPTPRQKYEKYLLQKEHYNR